MATFGANHIYIYISLREHKPAKSMGMVGQDKLIIQNRGKGKFIILSESILYGNGTSISFMMAY